MPRALKFWPGSLLGISMVASLLLTMVVALGVWIGAWLSGPVLTMVGYRPLDLGIYGLDLRTGQFAQVVADAVIGFRWSPDGSMLAYTTYGDSTREYRAVFVTASGREVYRTPSYTRSFVPLWSPDSQQVAFLAKNETSGLKLVVVRPYDSAQRVYQSGQVDPVAWAADMNALYGIKAEGVRSLNYDLTTLVLADDGLQEVNVSSMENASFQATTYHAVTVDDAVWLAYASPHRDGRAIYTQRLDTGAEPELFVTQDDNLFIRHWSPDASELLVFRVAGFLCRLSTLNPADGRLRDLASGVPCIGEADWSPDGRYIAYERSIRSGESWVEVIAADQGEAGRVRQIGGDGVRVQLPQWRPR